MSNARELAELGGSYGTGGFVGMKNRIINGAMMIDARNAGASVSSTGSPYTLDRWQALVSQAGKFTVQQNAGSVTPPAGFKNYLGVTSSSAYSVISSDYFVLWQPIEGFNTADLGFGAAGASAVTLSFWVRSSLTGTFGGTLRNATNTRNYVFSYTISAANTWEQKTITIAGDTSGTWVGATNAIGMTVVFSLGAGTTSTPNTWLTGDNSAPTGQVSVVGTNGATFYITGVQLEKGSTATSFDYRPYGTELALCQRYFQYVPFSGTAVAAGEMSAAGMFRVEMRTSPSLNSVLRNTAGYTDGTNNTLFRAGIGNQSVGAASIASGSVNTNGFTQLYTTSGLTSTAPNNVYSGSVMMSAEL